MKIIGIDYGRKKIGLALGDTESWLAEPLSVIRFDNIEQALEKISGKSKEFMVSKAVLGVSEGKMANETKNFGLKLKKLLGIPVVFQDETLTTHEAQSLAIESGIKRKKRRNLEDAYSACLILQNYLDSKG